MKTALRFFQNYQFLKATVLDIVFEAIRELMSENLEVPRVVCGKHGVKQLPVSWAEKHSDVKSFVVFFRNLKMQLYIINCFYSVHSLHRTSACSKTVCVAFSCLSGG